MNHFFATTCVSIGLLLGHAGHASAAEPCLNTAISQAIRSNCHPMCASSAAIPAKTASTLKTMLCVDEISDGRWTVISSNFFGREFEAAFPGQPEYSVSSEAACLCYLDCEEETFYIIAALPTTFCDSTDLGTPEEFLQGLNSGLDEDTQLISYEFWSDGDAQWADLVLLNDDDVYLKVRVYVSHSHVFILTMSDTQCEPTENSVRFFESFKFQ